MFGAILKATNSSFQTGMTFCRSLYMERDMKLLAFIFEQPSYIYSQRCDCLHTQIMEGFWWMLVSNLKLFHKLNAFIGQINLVFMFTEASYDS